MKKNIGIIVVLFYVVLHLVNAVGLLSHSFIYALMWLLFAIIEAGICVLIVKLNQKQNKLGVVLSFGTCGWLIVQSVLSLAIMLSANSAMTGNADKLFVLGYQLDNNQMTSTLISRLETAYDYATENPDCDIIVSGGITRNNTVSEASLMKQALISFGLDEDRIITEENSKDTIENIRYCKELVNNGEKVVVVSSQYHCARIKAIASSQDLEVKTIGASAPIHLLMNQLMIEKIAILGVWLS